MNAAFRIRPAFSARALSASTNTHTAEIVPKTPNVECARSITSLLVIFIRPTAKKENASAAEAPRKNY